MIKLYIKPAMRPLQFFNDNNRSTLSVASFAHHRNKLRGDQKEIIPRRKPTLPSRSGQLVNSDRRAILLCRYLVLVTTVCTWLTWGQWHICLQSVYWPHNLLHHKVLVRDLGIRDKQRGMLDLSQKTVNPWDKLTNQQHSHGWQSVQRIAQQVQWLDIFRWFGVT